MSLSLLRPVHLSTAPSESTGTKPRLMNVGLFDEPCAGVDEAAAAAFLAALAALFASMSAVESAILIGEVGRARRSEDFQMGKRDVARVY